MGQNQQVVRALIFILFYFSPAPARAQHKVVLSPEQQHQLQVPESEYYVLYTATEYRQLRALDQKEKALVEKLKLEVRLQQETIDGLKLSVQLLQKDLKHWRDYGHRMFDKWGDCDLKWRQAAVGGWWPWIITAAALVGTVTASSFAVYYRYR